MSGSPFHGVNSTRRSGTVCGVCRGSTVASRRTALVGERLERTERPGDAPDSLIFETEESVRSWLVDVPEDRTEKHQALYQRRGLD